MADFSFNLQHKEKKINVIFGAKFYPGSERDGTNASARRWIQVQDDNAAFRTVNIENVSESEFLSKIQELLAKGYTYGERG